MKIHNKTINIFLTVSIVILFFSVYGFAMLRFLHPLPATGPNQVGDNIFISDSLPLNSRILGIDITSDDRIYLHSDHHTLCFDENGVYLGRFIYYSQGATFFFPVESSDNFWILYGRSRIKYLCDPKGNVLQTVQMDEDEYIVNQEYNQKAADSNGNVYFIQRFLFFSRVMDQNGSIFYDQSVIFITLGILILVSIVLTIVFAFIKVKKKIGSQSFLDWAIRGGMWK